MRTHGTPDWTEAEDQRLIALWREHNSMTEIANSGEFSGRTRNAVIGRLTRLRKKLGTDVVRMGADGRPPNKIKKKRIRRKTFNIKDRAIVQLCEPTPEKIRPLPPQARQLSLLELGPRDCRFIVTGSYTRRHLYCAADAGANVDQYGNNCYCTYHARLMRAGYHFV